MCFHEKGIVQKLNPKVTKVSCVHPVEDTDTIKPMLDHAMVVVIVLSRHSLQPGFLRLLKHAASITAKIVLVSVPSFAFPTHGFFNSLNDPGLVTALKKLLLNISVPLNPAASIESILNDISNIVRRIEHTTAFIKGASHGFSAAVKSKSLTPPSLTRSAVDAVLEAASTPKSSNAPSKPSKQSVPSKPSKTGADPSAVPEAEGTPGNEEARIDVGTPSRASAPREVADPASAATERKVAEDKAKTAKLQDREFWC